MIYLDTSVALAELLSEDRKAPEALWFEPLVASRLLEYELWSRVHARGLGASHGDTVRELLAQVSLVELLPAVLERALQPFTSPLRTLDAMHLATAHHLAMARQRIAMATFDERMRRGARALGLDLAF